ncbi:hypothetical protein FSP39_006739 [Pinctada imbricata]|uniref:Peptidase M28 domain-containing protein n=1 Tax=Pinctada imbricata TaxID=66713 RepID=A0AA88Y9H1_PINIB|nr:hypothetical protein FSP39_006739 [Pinctada imbricata]
MATLKSPRNFRSWTSVDSLDPNDVQRLYRPDTPGTKPRGRCVSTWTFSLVVLMISVFFLVGLLVGFYIRENQQSDDSGGACVLNQRSDGLTEDELRRTHEQITYYLSGESIRITTEDLGGSSDRSTNSEWDRQAIRYLQREFEQLPLDKVQVHEYLTAVTYPNPAAPNRLEIIDSSNKTLLNTSLTSTKETRGETRVQRAKPPHVSRSVSGTVEGEVVYGNYGNDLDLLHLQNASIRIQGSILLLRYGSIPVYTILKNAELYGLVGVLLYDDPGDLGVAHSEDFIPYASIQPDYNGNVPSIPVQTISAGTAKQLLLTLDPDGMEAPPAWQGGLNITYRMGHSANMSKGFKVRLTVNNSDGYERVVNVIASLSGDVESDRVIMIGASRNSFPGSTSDTVSGSAHLLEMVKAFTTIKDREKWSPRRSIFFCSWGGSELSKAGLLAYLQQHKYLFPRQTVTYVDLDLHVSQENINYTSLAIQSNTALIDLVESVLHLVPDPSVHRLSLADELHLHSNSGIQAEERHSLVWGRGVPVLSATYRLRKKEVTSGDGLLADARHHFRYHLAAARVMSLLSLRLIDDTDLPFNLANLTYSVYKNVKRTVKSIANDALASNLLRKATELRDRGNLFQQYIKTQSLNKIPMDKRKINDVKMFFYKVFTVPHEIRSCQVSNMLDTDSTGHMSVLKHPVDIAMVTGDWTRYYIAKDKFLLAMSEAASLLTVS